MHGDNGEKKNTNNDKKKKEKKKEKKKNTQPSAWPAAPLVTYPA
jgi:hypothetical protein